MDTCPGTAVEEWPQPREQWEALRVIGNSPPALVLQRVLPKLILHV